MSIEQLIAANTAALEALTAAIKAGGTAAPAAETTKVEKTEKTKVEKTKADEYEAKHGASEMQALLNKVKETKGVADAKRIISEIGKAAKMADITDPKLVDAVFNECEKVLGGDEEDM